MKISTRLSLSFGIIIALALGLGGFATRAMQTSAVHAVSLSGEDLPSIHHYLGLQGELLLSCLGVRTYGYTAKPADKEFGARYLEAAGTQLASLRTLAQTNNSPELKLRAEELSRQFEDFSRLSNRTVAVTVAMKADKAALDQIGSKLVASLNTLNATLLRVPETSRPSIAELLEFNTQSHAMRLAVWHGIANREVAHIDHANTLGTALLAFIATHRDAAPGDSRLQWQAVASLVADYMTTFNRFAENWRAFDDSNKERFDGVARTLSLIDGEAKKTLKHMADEGQVTAGVLNLSVHRLWLGLGVIVLIAVAVTFVITRSLTGPINACVAAVQHLAQGDLTVKIGMKRKDELGVLAESVDTCIENLRSLVTDLKQSSTALLGSAQVLTATAHSQSAAAEQTTVQAHTVASAGEELSNNSQTMSESAAQITQSTTTVAAAMEEMSSSIQEVARNCAQESEIARKADTQARQTRELMGKLDESARQIGKVVDLINRIAEQTNLLALNATIEAASAGEAGRGFAVVANEVKELARQSAAATENIRQQVTLIQSNAGASMRSLDEVAKIIEQVSHISSSIAAAVEEQSATTSEIVGTIHNVSTSTGTLSKNVQQTAEGAAEVARNINGVSQAAADTAKSAARISTSATELNALSATLGQLVAKFKI